MRQTPEAAFEEIADPVEAAVILDIVAAGRPLRVDPADVAAGPGAGWVMAAFLQGSAARFNDGTFGAFYAAQEEATAIAETQFHYTKFLTDAHDASTMFSAQMLLADFSASLTDIRGRMDTLPQLYDPDPAHYGPTQQWAAEQRATGAEGIVYDRVRAKGQCVALFVPRLVTECRLGDRIAYEWNGTRFTDVYTVTRRTQDI